MKILRYAKNVSSLVHVVPEDPPTLPLAFSASRVESNACLQFFRCFAVLVSPLVCHHRLEFEAFVTLTTPN